MDSNISSQTAADWESITLRIRAGDSAAIAELYQLVSASLRSLLGRKLWGRNVEDKLHDTFIAVVDAIRRDEIREPERLPGFIRTVASRQAVAEIRSGTRIHALELDSIMGFMSDPAIGPEQEVLEHERAAIGARILRSLPSRQRDILHRFYLEEQPPERICAEMGLTATQFRLLKSRAKARFAHIGARRIQARNLHRLTVRTA